MKIWNRLKYCLSLESNRYLHIFEIHKKNVRKGLQEWGGSFGYVGIFGVKLKYRNEWNSYDQVSIFQMADHGRLVSFQNQPRSSMCLYLLIPHGHESPTFRQLIPIRFCYHCVGFFLFFIFIFFSVRLLSVLRGHPRHSGQWPQTSKDFLSQILTITFIFLS